MLIGSVAELGVPSQQVAKFYGDAWSRPVMLADRKFYEWQFKGPPQNRGRDSCVIAYDDTQNAVAGVMGLNERDFYHGRVRCVDWHGHFGRGAANLSAQPLSLSEADTTIHQGRAF